MTNNYREPNTKKRGRTPNKLTAKLFLLNPDHVITKVTKETCSKEAIEQLMQNGYGPPQPEHCTKDKNGHSTKTVQFSFELSNEEFKQKLVHIYPKLEKSCFVFMKAEKLNKLVVLNPGECCFKCYTPENVYQRGYQGRLYIQVIADSEISPCNHGVSVAKCPRTDVSSNQTRYRLILPKPDMSNIIIVPQLTRPVQKSGNAPAQRPMLPSTSVSSGVPVTAQHHSRSSVVSIETRSPSLHSSLSPPIDTQQLSKTYSQTTSSSPAPLTGDKTDSKLQKTFNEASPDSFSPFSSLSDSDDPTVVELPTDTSTNNSHEKDQSPPLTTPPPLTISPPAPVIENVSSSPSPDSFQDFPPNSLPVQDQSLESTVNKPSHTHNLERMVVSPSNSAPVDGSSNGTQQAHVTENVSSNSNVDQQFLNDLSFDADDIDAFTTYFDQFVLSNSLHGQVQSPESAMITQFLSEAFTAQSTSCENVSNPYQNFGDTDGAPSNLPSVDGRFNGTRTTCDIENVLLNSNMILDQLLSTDQLYLSDELATGFSDHQALATSSHVQESFDLRQPEELRVYESTSTVKISLAVLNNDALIKRLNESTIDIHTVEIESTCKLHLVLSRYSLPSCLKVLCIKDNSLNFEDIEDLATSLSYVNSLCELQLLRTKFEEYKCFNAFLCVLRCSGKSLTSLSLTNNGLTKEEITSLITTIRSMRNLKKLNLSKSNITEAQANVLLQELVQANIIASLDLSHNALRGNENIIGICQLQSLQEVDLSHNLIRFSPLPDFEAKHDSLSTNAKNISLSSNHMMPDDISRFCTLIGSDLLKLNLDFNHVCNSIWSLCSIRLRIKHLKVLSLQNIYISDASAVNGLAALLSSVGVLEELNLSSNNLVLADFQQIQSPLSNLPQLKRLNLSNNPDGVSTLLEKILPSLKNLEELRLSNTHLNCDDLNKICNSLASLKSLKYLELSMNSISSGGIRELASILQEFPLLERLDLSRSCLQGDDINVLCQSLVSLKKLKYLNLSSNTIDSQILDDAWVLLPTLEELSFSDVIHGEKLFAKLKPVRSLKKLYLTKLKLRACDVEMLATTLSSFPTLEELSLNDIVFSDSKGDKIFGAIRLLGNLRKLRLTKLKLRLYDIEVLATTLLSFPNLEELSLANIVVENSNLDKLFRTIKSLENIKKIDLSGIKLCDESGLADMLSSLLSLEELVLSGVNVLNMDDVRFFSAIKLLKRLRKLDLGRINVREEKALFDMLSSLSMLEEIVFPAVVLGNSGGPVGYFRALESLRYLKNLDLRSSRICKPAQEALTRGLLSLQLLQSLAFGSIMDCDIDFSDQYDEQLFAALGNLKYLEELDLAFTKITKTSAEALARVLPSLTLLETLRLQWFDCDDECDEQLFAALRNLKYLKELHICSAYNITKTGVEALARVLPSLTLLEELRLGWFDRVNECNEQLFAALGSLKYLKELSLVGIDIAKPGAEALARVLPSLTLLEELMLEWIDRVDECNEQPFVALENLKYLKELKLDNTHITKPVAEALAHVLPSTLLEKLMLRGIYCDDECGEQLFTALGNLKYLQELYLSSINITKPIGEALARMLPSLTLLEKLVLRGIYCDDECGEQLFAALGNLKYLQELYLSSINITNSGAEALARVLPSLTLLEKFLLTGIDFDDESCDKKLFAALGNLKYLNKLSLINIYITKTGAEALAHVLPSLTFLEKLELTGIDCDDECDEQLFAALGNLKYLKELNLIDANITKSGSEALVRVLPSFTLLEKLVLEGIGRDDECGEQLFAALGNLKYLKKLHLNCINITKTGTEALAGALTSLGLLRELFLHCNSFENTSDDQLFSAMGSLSLLNTLHLSCSAITQTGATALTTTLPRLRYLKCFYLWKTRIENDEEETLRKNLMAAASFVFKKY